MTSLFCVNTITNPQTLKGKSLLMDIITYLLSLIQSLYQQNCWLINFICRYIPLKHWAFNDKSLTQTSHIKNGIRTLKNQYFNL